MGAYEKLILNPVEFVPTLPEIDLSAAGIDIGAAGPDYGESSVTVERVKQAISEGVTNAHWPSVEATVPLIVGARTDSTMASAFGPVEAFVAELQRRNSGWIRRDFADSAGFSGSVGCPVDAAALTTPKGNNGIDEITLKLSRYPIWFATVEIDKDAEGNPLEVKGSAVRDLQLELADLLGTAPGLITVRLKNEGAEDWRGCYVSLECDSFSSAATALPRYSAAQLTPKGGSVISAAAAPEVRAVGTVAAGVGSISPGLPAGTATGDLLVMVAESGGAAAAGEANTALTAAGWKESPLAAAVKQGNTRLTLLYRIAEAANATATNDTGDHQLARIIGIKAGTFDPVNPFNVAGRGTQAATKTVNVTGATTTRDNCLIIACASGNLPDTTTAAEFGAGTNASLTGLTERIDNTTAEGDGGAIWAMTGVLAAHGTYVTSASTAVTEAERAVISLAVNPIAEVVKCPPLTAGWVTVLESPIGGTEHMTHVDPRRMIFRIDDVSTELNDVKWKLEWRTLGAAGWNQTMVASTPLVVSSPVVGNYQLLDLGEARPERPVIGNPRFQWRLQAHSVNSSGKQPLIRDVYPMSTEQWARVSDTSPAPSSGAPTAAPGKAEDATGTGTVAWQIPGELGGYAEAALQQKAGEEASHYLKATQFGFALPESAIILGIVASVKRRVGSAGGPGVSDHSVKLVKAGAVGGTDHVGAGEWTNTDVVATYGSSADLWGLTWTRAQINESGFGVAISAQSTATRHARIDAITITVYYAESANSETHICFATRSIDFTDSGVRRQHLTEEVWGDVPAPEGMLLKAPAPGQAGQSGRLLAIPSVGDLATRADSASVKLAATVSYRPGYLFAREAS